MEDINIYWATEPTIAFLPIDIEYDMPDEDKIIQYCKDFHVPMELTKAYAPAWEITPVCGRFAPEQWWDPAVNHVRWSERYLPNMGPLQYVNDIDTKFPEIRKMIEQFPYKEIGCVALARQVIPVSCHVDWFKTDKDSEVDERSITNEPRRFNIQMTKRTYKSFYVADSEEGERYHINLPKNVPGFAITEMYNWHGADMVGPDKIMLVMYGIIDKEKRDELVRRSIKLYHDDAIVFDKGKLVGVDALSRFT
jgi:hypothetical protein